MSTARQAAIANENAMIDASQSRAIAASKPRSALESMAGRLQIQPANLKATLMNTVFKDCRNDSEFAALIVVANEHGLNPLLKEIYAFPAKGGGVVPMVSVDGWIKLMNGHPMFDGIEFEYTLDHKTGDTIAIEAIIYRRDRNRPIKVMEWMKECERQTDPWKKSPRRMLRHRALIQGVRVAFGFTGIAAEGDEDVVEGVYSEAPIQSLPRQQDMGREIDDEIPDHDKETGEVIETDAQGMTVVDEDTARELDQRAEANRTMADIDGPLEQQDERPVWAAKMDELKAGLEAATKPAAVKVVEGEYLKHAISFPSEVASEFEALLKAKKQAVSGGAA